MILSCCGSCAEQRSSPDGPPRMPVTVPEDGKPAIVPRSSENEDHLKCETFSGGWRKAKADPGSVVQQMPTSPGSG